MSDDEREQLKTACRLVENHCRSFGRDCQVVFLDKTVTIAPSAWSGESSGDTLFAAIMDAMEVDP